MKLSRAFQLPVLLASALLAPVPLVSAEHTSNWAVLVGTSRFWFNYRHLANVLSMYRTVKRLGIPDSQIILMLPDDMACNPRNAFPGTVYSNSDRAVDLYGDNIEVDYRGYEVTVENFIRLLTDRVGDEMPRSKRLLTDDRSNIFIYMTGHGGNEFLKFQDAEEIGAFDLADAFEQMWEKRRYHEILFMIDTCQANTMYSKFYSPNIIATGSSELDQSSYSHHADNDVGVAVIDRYTYYNLEFLESEVKDLSSKKTIGDLFDSYSYDKIHSDAGVRYDLFRGGADAARSRLLTDFLGNIQNVEVDGSENATIDEEMLALSKTIAALTKMAEEEEAAAKNSTVNPAEAKSQQNQTKRQIHQAKPLTDDDCSICIRNMPTMSSSKEPRTKVTLESISLSAVPMTTHNVAWSPDAELALGCEDSVYIYLPEFSPPSAKVSRANYESIRQYNDVALRFPVVELRRPELNRPLFDAVEQEFQVFDSDPTLTAVPITGMAGSLNHVVALEWSPCGLGRMKRSVLAVLTSGGAITIYCEGVSDGMGSLKVQGRNTRTLRSWVVPWAVGGALHVPTVGADETIDRSDHITAFAWARETGAPGALLAYATHDNEVVVLSVQARHKAEAAPGHAGDWRVEEVARFLAEGPHQLLEPTDPDYTTGGSSFSISWSPWLNQGNSKSSIISYIAKNYVGFRQVTVRTPWRHMETPKVDVAPVDSSGICLFLGPDAFVVWEDWIWTVDNEKVCRGLVATPARVQAFQLPFGVGPSTAASLKHSVYECDTAYPTPEDSAEISNPITAFTLVRLCATSKNDNWHQTNLSLPADPETHEREPRWATEIEQSIQHQLPRTLAFQMIYTPENENAEQGEDGSDDDDLDGDSAYEPGEGDEDGDGDGDDIAGMRGLDTSDQVHTTRMRIWGMASSPGKGVTAVFVTPQSPLKPDRITFGGTKCRVLFGRHVAPEGKDDLPAPPTNLSTEARMWEWMYGGGPPVPGIESAGDRATDTPLKRKFAGVARSRLCPFCGTVITPDGKASRCVKGHVFENCATTGIPIMAPGVSNTCTVCGSKCLKPGELLAMASDVEDIRGLIDEISPELCGGCGGKFFN
ncbi:hypothetical protein DL769_010079 [Monosporascus sp. CRB-8-3]|nr:hypothetical protein DL769_010079 [Monosporascus sp. CRB-8-3]